MGGTNGSVKYDSIERIHYSNLVRMVFIIFFFLGRCGKNIQKYILSPLSWSGYEIKLWNVISNFIRQNVYNEKHLCYKT